MLVTALGPGSVDVISASEPLMGLGRRWRRQRFSRGCQRERSPGVRPGVALTADATGMEGMGRLKEPTAEGGKQGQESAESTTA